MVEPTAQQFLEIEEIREGVIILKNKSLRGIIMVSSLNFGLKSQEEQEAIIYQFQDFLNSLDFSIEIVVQSRRLNLTGYLDKLREAEKTQRNELLKIQTADYVKFIESLIGGGTIMSKNFFVVVPFVPISISGLTPTKSSPSTKKTFTSFDSKQFQQARFQLWQRMEFVSLGLRRCGLQCSLLNTSELIELLWSWYHPEEAEVGYYPEIPPEIIT